MIKRILSLFVLLAFVSGITFYVITERKNKSIDPWDSWIEHQTEFSIIGELAKAKRKRLVLSKSDIAEMRDKMQAELKVDAAALKNVISVPPPLHNIQFQYQIDDRMPPKKYEGPWPQTAESLMTAFDEDYNSGNPTDNEIEGEFPRAEWLTKLLEKGAFFEHYGDYSGLLNTRWTLLGLKDKPEKWDSDKYGDVPTQDWETFIESYIDRKIWETEQIRTAQKTDPTVSGGTFMGPGDTIFLPFTGNRLYVELFEDGASTIGASISRKERYNLINRGIHPEGLDVVYVDFESGTFLNEKPAPISWDTILEKAGPPPPGWEKNLPESLKPPPTLVKAINKRWENTDTLPETETTSHEQFKGNPLPETVGQDDFPENIAQNQQNFTQSKEEFLEMLTKIDVESETAFEAELEKYLTQENLKVPSEVEFENEMRKKFEEEVLTPIILEKAMETLERDGLTEGFRRLQKEDPEVAKVIAELLSTRSPQRKSHRNTPPPKPPETEEN